MKDEPYNSDMFYKFLAWEAATKDTIDVKRIYIDLAGDLHAGIMLSQIIYWYLPGKNGKTKLRVRRKGRLWLAKRYEDWYGEVRLTKSQSRRALGILKDKDFIITEIMRFNGTPQVHLRLNWGEFSRCLNEQLDSLVEKMDTDLC